MTVIALSENADRIISQGIRTVLCEFLFDICSKHRKLEFSELCKRFLPPDELKNIKSMEDLRNYSIRELQMFLAGRGCRHTSGAKSTLIERLWKILHPYNRDIQKLVPLEWNREKNNPEKWKAIWAIREANVGKCVDSKTPHAQLYKIDSTYTPPLVLFETSKEFIIEGVFDIRKEAIIFGKYPPNFNTQDQR